MPQYGADCHPQGHTERGHGELTQTAKNTKTPEHFERQPAATDGAYVSIIACMY